MTNSENKTKGISRPFFVVGLCLMFYAFYISTKAFELKNLTNDQRFILLWIMPLSSGFICGSFAGAISARTKKGYAGWAVAATGGFAVWVLSYLFLPSIQEPPKLKDAVSISLIKGIPFKSAVDIIAQNNNSVAELIGFNKEQIKRKIVNTKLSGDNHRILLINLRFSTENSESFPKYDVIAEGSGKYVLQVQ